MSSTACQLARDLAIYVAVPPTMLGFLKPWEPGAHVHHIAWPCPRGGETPEKRCSSPPAPRAVRDPPPSTRQDRAQGSPPVLLLSRPRPSLQNSGGRRLHACTRPRPSPPRPGRDSHSSPACTPASWAPAPSPASSSLTATPVSELPSPCPLCLRSPPHAHTCRPVCARPLSRLPVAAELSVAAGVHRVPPAPRLPARKAPFSALHVRGP